jgi:hypothetical protein
MFKPKSKVEFLEMRMFINKISTSNLISNKISFFWIVCLSGVFNFTGNTFAQWMPIDGFQEDSIGNYSYYTKGKKKAVKKCMEVLEFNNVNLLTVQVDMNYDPIINNNLPKEDEPDVMHLVYIAKTTTGYVVRLKYFKRQYREFEEAFMVIVYDDDQSEESDGNDEK